ncbi:large ribosomal subunit protein mL48 [Bacillus rossius redtenbacheri]|uniref:large ribosomal subunit protein mL48 n=1 Tax=Bacillus rossius redtenbacheri TaxID=93214 RepID=UPI002FDDE8D8
MFFFVVSHGRVFFLFIYEILSVCLLTQFMSKMFGVKQLSQQGWRCLRCLVQQRSLSCSRSLQGIYEPDYLDKLKPDIPVYNALNIQMKGYDFPVLENYQKFVHSIAESMDIEVEDSWALPPQHLQIQRYKPQSSIVDSEYKLLVYERNVQVTDLPSTVAAVFLEVIQAVLPEGVSLSVHEHLREHEEARFVPDQQLKELKTELDSLGGPVAKKK